LDFSVAHTDAVGVGFEAPKATEVVGVSSVVTAAVKPDISLTLPRLQAQVAIATTVATTSQSKVASFEFDARSVYNWAHKVRVYTTADNLRLNNALCLSLSFLIINQVGKKTRQQLASLLYETDSENDNDNKDSESEISPSTGLTEREFNSADFQPMGMGYNLLPPRRQRSAVSQAGGVSVSSAQ